MRIRAELSYVLIHIEDQSNDDLYHCRNKQMNVQIRPRVSQTAGKKNKILDVESVLHLNKSLQGVLYSNLVVSKSVCQTCLITTPSKITNEQFFLVANR